MIQRRNFCLTLALALLLGCGGGVATKAQEKPGAPDAKPDDKPPEKADGKPPEKADAKPDAAHADKGDKLAKDLRSYRATVTDKSTEVKDYVIRDAVIWAPEVSILGGEGHTEEKQLIVKRGAAELIVPFADIAWFELGTLKEDRLEIKVKRVSQLKSEDPKVRELVLIGTIKSNLQLSGKYEDTTLQARLKLREVLKVVLEPEGAAKPESPK